MNASEQLAAHANDSVCHLQTIGRSSGRPRTIEIWFATDGERIYLLSGGRDRAHWVRNLQANPAVRVRIGGRTIGARASIIEGTEHEVEARHRLAAKYQGWTDGSRLSAWASESLPVEIVPESDSRD